MTLRLSDNKVLPCACFVNNDNNNNNNNNTTIIYKKIMIHC